MHRSDLGCGMLAVYLSAAAAALAAGPWPQRPVHVIVPFGAGSAPDVASRVFARNLSAQWKQPIVIENRTGADGVVGVTAFAAQHDDHALLFSPAAPISVFPLTRTGLAYDPARDFVPISGAVETFGAIAVSASLGARSLQELVARARAHPGELNWASGGGAFPTLLAGFAKTERVDLLEISYREQSLALQDLAAGRIQIVATTLTALLPLAAAGRIHILAVTNRRRAPGVPEIPTAIEAGYPELQFEGLIGFFGGRDMPAALRDRISADVRAAAADPAVAAALAAAGQLVAATGPDEFAGAIEEQRDRMRAVVRAIEGSR